MSTKLFFSRIMNPALALIFCCFQFLFLQVSCSTSNMSVQLASHIDVIANSSTSCSSPVMECADLGNISYPFWGSTSCAASPSYVLSNCSSSTGAYWNSFSAAAHGVVGPPAVTWFYSGSSSGDLYYLDPTLTIGLSWNRSLNDGGICPLFSSTNLSQYNIPSSINLSSFPVPHSSKLTLSNRSIFLLFNCTQFTVGSETDASSQFLAGSEANACREYESVCGTNISCIQWNLPLDTQEVMLQGVLENFSCSHFTFGIYNGSRAKWDLVTRGSIAVNWADLRCENCENAQGTCTYAQGINIYFNYCEPCTEYCDIGCSGGLFHCSKVAKIGVPVALAIVVLGFGFGLVARYYGGMIRKGLKNGFLSFIRAIIPVVISVLKKTLKKLQTSIYVPSLTIDTMGLDGLTERPMEYSYSSIASATKSFRSLVGEGGFGVVYKGTLPRASSDGGSDLQIAVKVLQVRSKHSKQQFLNEVITIGRIHHVNVVRLLGFCIQEDNEMLVYEYVENGSLDRWLFDEKQVLDWGHRYAIAMGIARGLSYLHEECRHRIVHCDIKPHNILLDGKMCPKIADFGLARLMSRDESKVMTIAKGTPGYMAPEFWMGGEGQLSTKFDVYSYGMMLLELISGQHNFRHDAMSTGTSFPAMAFKAATQGDLESILDTRLGITKNTPDSEEAQKLQWHQIKTAVFVALWCIQDHPAKRPSMSEVVMYLEGRASVSECLPQPAISIFSTSSTPPEPHSMHRQQDFTPISVGR